MAARAHNAASSGLGLTRQAVHIGVRCALALAGGGLQGSIIHNLDYIYIIIL